MRLSEDDKMWVGVDDYWSSRMISPALLDAARGDRSLWPDMAAKISKFDANAMIGARAFASASQTSMLFQGTGDLGLPAYAIGDVAKAMGPLIMNPPKDLNELYESLARAGVGVAINILGVIPIVGIIVEALGTMGLFIWDLSRMKQDKAREYLPPPQAYSRNAEELVMNTQLLPALSTNDWTGLFLPRVGNMRKVTEIENGWLFDSTDGGSGLGFIPGTQQISSSIQALWHKKSNRTGGTLATYQDVGDFYSGPAQLMTALDQQVQRPGAELWAVAPSIVRGAWRDYVDASRSFAYDLWFGRGLGGTGLGRANDEHRRLIIQQFLAPLHVSYVGDKLRRGMLAANSWSPKNPPDDIVEGLVGPWCDRLAKRQDYFLGTIAVAYADPTSAAFVHEPKLKDKLEKMRKSLLKSPARYDVDYRDVIDNEYRAALFKATTGGLLKSPDSDSGEPGKPTPLDGAGPEPEPPQLPQGGASLDAQILRSPPRPSGDGLALGIGVLGLALALGWKLKRHR